ncbi:hypothetical protein P3102_10265 [Amycolatopsis sp. QT-25]|uniref:hypothetical protein n=1 Tax=Amycolatopsis sp. QT-25 TaxID=3034022 RepID=UPI0023EB849F|nr:hypothetical protein [Amycolatopsis sp. QT-25]WET81564.1 hypothetical protein P3102_10265 [Amycolatopsis sp. QT-25]
MTGGSEGDRFVRDAGLAMALTVAEVARSGEIRARLIARVGSVVRDAKCQDDDVTS